MPISPLLERSHGVSTVLTQFDPRKKVCTSGAEQPIECRPLTNCLEVTASDTDILSVVKFVLVLV